MAKRTGPASKTAVKKATAASSPAPAPAPVPAAPAIAPKAPAKAKVAKPVITNEMIGRRAYEIWERKGRPIGKDLENWQEAERELGVK